MLDQRKRRRAAIYARYSSRFQKSIDDQIRRCREWCEANGVQVDERMIFIDRAQTGKKAGRPGFQALMKAISQGDIDVVVAFATSRLHRKIHLALQFVEEQIVERKLRCVFVNQGIDTDRRELWKALLMVYAMLDEFQTTSAVNHIRAGQEGLLLKGRVHNTLAWGYTGVEIEGEVTRLKKPSRKLAIDEELRPWVKQAFEWCVKDGLTYKAVARRLTAANVRPPAKALRWSSSAVRYLLMNRRSIGDWSYGRTESLWYSRLDGVRQEPRTQPLRPFQADWLRMIDDGLFDAAQQRIEALRLGKGSGRWKKNAVGDDLVDPLHSILWCPEHGNYLVPGGAGGRSWICRACKRSDRPSEQFLYSQIDRQLALRLVVDAVAGVMDLDDATFEEIVKSTQAHIDQMLTVPAADTSGVERQIEKLKNSIAALFDSPGETDEERAETKAMVVEKRREKRDLSEQLAVMKAGAVAPAVMPSEQTIRQAALQMQAVLQGAVDSDDAEGRRKLNAVIRIVTGGRIDLQQVGPRAAKQGHLRGSFTPSIIGGIAQVVGVNGVREPENTPKVVIDFTSPGKLETDGERVVALMQASPELTQKEIGRRLGLSPSRVWLARKDWHERRGRAMPGLKQRGQQLKNAAAPPVYIQISNEAAALYAEGLLLNQIAAKLGVDEATVHKGLLYDHRRRGVEYVDGRLRRKQCGVKSRPAF